jgi:hypothetical protein
MTARWRGDSLRNLGCSLRNSHPLTVLVGVCFGR